MAMANVIAVNIIGYAEIGVELVTSLHFATSDGIAVTITPQMLEDFISNLMPDYRACITPDWKLDHCTMQPLYSGSVVILTSVTGAGEAGLNGGTVGPYERCLVLKKKTIYSGRQFRGRIFMPLPDNQFMFADGRVDTAAVATAPYNTFMTDLLDSGVCTFDTKSFVSCIYHKATSSYTPINSMVMSDLVGIQRRRRAGIGS